MELRVVTANAASGRGPQGEHDHARWVREAALVATDVWAVQEVDRGLPRSGSRDQVADLVEALGPGWRGRFGAAVHGTPGSTEGVRPARAGDPVEASYGVALLTPLPVTAWLELHLEPSSARLPMPVGPGRMVWVEDEPRVALAAVVEGPVTLVSTHLSFAPTRAVRQLREVVRWASTLPGPTVLLGDLNLPRGVAAWASGMTAAAPGPTYPSGSPRVQLDHVLVSAGRLADVSTLVVGGSDHLAVRATVVLD